MTPRAPARAPSTVFHTSQDAFKPSHGRVPSRTRPRPTRPRPSRPPGSILGFGRPPADWTHATSSPHSSSSARARARTHGGLSLPTRHREGLHRRRLGVVRVRDDGDAGMANEHGGTAATTTCERKSMTTTTTTTTTGDDGRARFERGARDTVGRRRGRRQGTRRVDAGGGDGGRMRSGAGRDGRTRRADDLGRGRARTRD